MQAIDGDGSPWSYLEASLFTREIAEFGALWHGCDWSTHTILGANPFGGGPAPGRVTRDADAWEWTEPVPDQWRPTVSMQGDAVTVTMYTHSALGSERIVRLVDRYAPGAYVAERESGVLAEGPGGFVF